MIFRKEVEIAAKESIESRLKTNQNALKFLTEPVKWTKWVDLLHVRCNELEWAIRSKWAMRDFIDKATIEYGRKQLDKALIQYDGK